MRSTDISFEYLNKLSTNAHEIHKLLAKFFDADTSNWRQLNNILYRSKRLPNAIKLVIKSDTDIDEEAVVLNGFEIVCKYNIEEKLSGSTLVQEMKMVKSDYSNAFSMRFLTTFVRPLCVGIKLFSVQ